VDTESRLILSGPALAEGYALQDDQAQWHWQPIGGSLTTRDLVELAETGPRRWLRFIGRESGFIKILGELVHLAPLQERLEALALQQNWAQLPVIVALPDARMESRLVMVSKNSDDADSDLLAAFNALTPAFCHLSQIIHLPEIPRSPLGKVNLAALTAMLLGT